MEEAEKVGPSLLDQAGSANVRTVDILFLTKQGNRATKKNALSAARKWLENKKD